VAAERVLVRTHIGGEAAGSANHFSTAALARSPPRVDSSLSWGRWVGKRGGGGAAAHMKPPQRESYLRTRNSQLHVEVGHVLRESGTSRTLQAVFCLDWRKSHHLVHDVANIHLQPHIHRGQSKEYVGQMILAICGVDVHSEEGS
jgi:hypothetical protein